MLSLVVRVVTTCTAQEFVGHFTHGVTAGTRLVQPRNEFEAWFAAAVKRLKTWQAKVKASRKKVKSPTHHKKKKKKLKKPGRHGSHHAVKGHKSNA